MTFEQRIIFFRVSFRNSSSSALASQTLSTQFLSERIINTIEHRQKSREFLSEKEYLSDICPLPILKNLKQEAHLHVIICAKMERSFHLITFIIKNNTNLDKFEIYEPVVRETIFLAFKMQNI